MRRVFAAIVFPILAVGAAEAQQSQIKGFYIGMSKADVFRLKPTEFIIKERAQEEGESGTILQFQTTDGDTSAEVHSDAGKCCSFLFLGKELLQCTGHDHRSILSSDFGSIPDPEGNLRLYYN